jgi:hypothetical protein
MDYIKSYGVIVYMVLLSVAKRKQSETLKIKEIIDETTTAIFSLYRDELLSKPITYILPAVWGKKHGKLSGIQGEIHMKINPLIRDIIEIFAFKEINEDQRFALEYLIRGLVISKITYLIESFKNRSENI